MGVPLRLLLVEDNENDAVLVVRELTRGGYDTTYERVWDAASMHAALDRQSWDLVLSDHSMPQFSGRAALDVLRQRDPDMPFIFVSGTIGEDAAVESMRMGAQDYLNKSNLRRLVPAIQRELREAASRRERRRAETALRESEQRFERVFQASPVGITISTLAEGRYVDVNAAFLRMIGRTREEVIGQTSFDISFWRDPADRARVMERLARGGGAAQELELTVQAKDGALRHVLVALEQVDFSEIPCVVALVHDISGLKQLEQQLNQAQKMEAVGRLAGGVAHDFNNMLTVITSYGDLLLGDLPAGDSRRADIEEILKAARGAATLTRQLLAFSRQEVIQPRPISVNAIVAGTENMLKRVIGEDIALESELTAEPATVLCDPGQLEQIVMNLVVNARDAMPQGGRVRIVTTNATLDEPALRDLPLSRPGERHGNRHGCRDPGTHLRALLHHQGAGQGHGTRPRHGVRGRQAGGRLRRGRERPRRGSVLHGIPPRHRRPGDPHRSGGHGRAGARHGDGAAGRRCHGGAERDPPGPGATGLYGAGRR
jgi:two-component system, cell cycle sensor histidine kinase and response regulator CckA